MSYIPSRLGNKYNRKQNVTTLHRVRIVTWGSEGSNPRATIFLRIRDKVPTLGGAAFP